MYPQQRRRSHTFTEGTFNDVREQYISSSSGLLSPNIVPRNIVIRQQSTGSSENRKASDKSPEIRKIDNRSPILQSLHRKFLSQDAEQIYHSDEEFQVRHRSRSFLTREDKCEFEIPNLTPPRSPSTPPLLRAGSSATSIDLGEFNPDLYRHHSSSDSGTDVSDDVFCKRKKVCSKSSLMGENKAHQLISTYEQQKYLDGGEKQVKDESVGTITLSFRYVPKKHNLFIKLMDVSLNYQPSPFVRESQWTIDPYLVVDIGRETRSTSENKGKLHLPFHKHHPHVMSKDDTCEISIKHKMDESHLIKILLFDGDVTNKDLAVGGVNLKLLKVLSSDGSEKIFTRQLSLYHQMYSHSEGVLTSSLQWNSQNMMLELGLQSISYPKPSHHAKELFVKANVYVGHVEIGEYKSDLLHSSKEVSINKYFDIRITSDRIRNMYILLQVYEKHLLGNISLHRTVIGPYMKPTLKHGMVTCWEKAIICPGEEVQCICELYP